VDDVHQADAGFCASEGKTIADYMNGCFILERKYDGHRFEWMKQGDRILAWSRDGKPRNELELPQFRDLVKLFPDGHYDGELFVPGGVSTDVTATWNKHKLQLAIFDMLAIGADPHWIMARPGSERRELLLGAFEHVGRDNPWVYPAGQSPVTSEGLQAIWDGNEQEPPGEGAVVKRTTTIYRPGKRTNDWVKFKRKGAAEVTIVGFLAGVIGPQNRHLDSYSIICGIDDHGIATQVKSLNDEWRAMFAREADQSINGVHPRIGTRMVISYTEKHRSGNYREPRADHLLED